MSGLSEEIDMSRLRLSLAVLLMIVAVSSLSAAQSYAVNDLNIAAPHGKSLYQFLGGPHDGGWPNGGLVSDPSGTLYGTAIIGGSHGAGTAFKLTPPSAPGGNWVETTLYNFLSGGEYDGYSPNTPVTLDSSGAVYGTTNVGGTHGYGTVFKLTPPSTASESWTETILYNFLGETDGAFPFGTLLIDKQGNLYGTTNDSEFGFGNDGGVVYELTPPTGGGGQWTETVLYLVGSSMQGNLTMDQAGALYGTSSDFGNFGSVFQLTPPASGQGFWTETMLYVFLGGSDGAIPVDGVVFGKDGSLYGTTSEGGSQNCASGCGTVFELTPPSVPGGPWTESLIHVFNGGDDGAVPYGGTALDRSGTVYGTAYSGGRYGLGTVYRLTPPATPDGSWQETTLHAFTGTDGANSVGRVLLGGNAIYGATQMGGRTNAGTVFQISR
jgi:uncharacterized repeat protein (TIGR03803 family)